MRSIVFQDISPVDLFKTTQYNPYDISALFYHDKLMISQIIYDAEKINDRIIMGIYCNTTNAWKTIINESVSTNQVVSNNKSVNCSMRVGNDDGPTSKIEVSFSSPRTSIKYSFDPINNYCSIKEIWDESKENAFNKLHLGGLKHKYLIEDDLKKITSSLSKTFSFDFLRATNDITKKILSDLYFLNNSLYVFVNNSYKGFAVWKSKNKNYSKWEIVIDRGAFRYVHNQQVLSVNQLNDSLYMVVGTPQKERYPYSKFSDYKGFEIIRLYNNDEWDLIAGVPRFTPYGLKIPMSGLGPGLDPYRAREWQATQVHDGQLFMAANDEDGFRIWKTLNGMEWCEIDRGNLSQIYSVKYCKWANYGNNSGLLLITKNSRGEEKIEVWLGPLIESIIIK